MPGNPGSQTVARRARCRSELSFSLTPVCPIYVPTRDYHMGGLRVSVCLRVYASVVETRKQRITEVNVAVVGTGKE